MRQSELTLQTVRRLMVWSGVAGATLVLVVLAAMGWVGWYEYQEILDVDRSGSEMEARVLEVHATRTVETTAVVLSYLSGELQALDLGVSHDEQHVNQMLAQALVALPFVREISVLDREGLVLASSAVQQRGRQVNMERLGALPLMGNDRLGGYHPGRSLSEPVVSGQPLDAGVGYIPMSRLLRSNNGQVRILVALINPDYLANFQALTLSDPSDSAYLLSYQGDVLSSAGPEQVPPGKQMNAHPVFSHLQQVEHGSYVGMGASASKQIVAFRLSKTRPLVVIVEQPVSASVSHWLTVMRWFGAAAAIFIIFIVAMTIGIRRSLRAREMSLVELVRVRADALRREDELKVLVKSVQELLFRTDADGVITYVNARWADLSEQDVDLAQNHRLADWMDQSNRADVEALFSHDETLVRTTTASLRGRDGIVNRLDIAVVPLNDGTEIVGFAGSAVDVTKRFAAERALQHQLEFVAQLLEISPLPVCTSDRYGHYLTVNRAWEDFVGFSKSRVIRQLPSHFMASTDAEIHSRNDALMWLSGGQMRYEAKLQHRDGSWRDVVFSKVIVAGDAEHSSTLLSLMMDVTEFRAAERAKDVARSAAEEASRAKSDFIANISHELRTPLQSILGFSELGLMRGREQPKLLGMFGDIHAAGERMLALVNDLLDVSKISSPVGNVNLESADVRELVASVVHELSPQLDSKRLFIDTHLGDAPLIGKVDPVRFSQVVRNVLANAIKFSPNGAAIEIRTEQIAEARLCISIRDHGVGIPHAELDRIFEAFVQSSTTKDGSGGTGLGLAICKTIMDAHGGSINASNMPEGGAVFTICLPTRKHMPRDTDFQAIG